MQCSKCHSEMVPSIQPGLQLIWACTWRGCSKGAMTGRRSNEQAPLERKREQARTKIQRLLAVAASTTFLAEAASARALASGLAAKHCLNV